MKRSILICLWLSLILNQCWAYAGCEELKVSIANLDKAIQAQSSVISDKISDTSFSARRAREQATAEIERLMKLREDLKKQDCLEANKPKPKQQVKQPQQQQRRAPNTKGRRPPARRVY